MLQTRLCIEIIAIRMEQNRLIPHTNNLKRQCVSVSISRGEIRKDVDIAAIAIAFDAEAL